jgi:hypothetical protein
MSEEDRNKALLRRFYEDLLEPIQQLGAVLNFGASRTSRNER